MHHRPSAAQPARTPPLHGLLFAVLLAGLTIALPDWHFSSPLDIDPWVYYGYFRHFRSFTTELFAGTYYGTRLGWIVPGYVAYSLFSPNVASIALHGVFYVTAILSLHVLVRRVAGARCAFVGAVLFAFYLPVIRAFGSDYVEGAVIAYSLVSAALMQQAGSTGSVLAALGSGVAAGAMLHSNLGAAFLFPSILVWVVPASVERAQIRVMIWGVLWWAVGIVCCTVILGLISVSQGGRWTFFVPSVTWLVQMGASNPWDRSGLAWVLEAPWVFMPAAALVSLMGVAMSLRRRRRLGAAHVRAIASFGTTLAIFAAWDFLGSGATLFWPFYSSWLAPGAVLVIASVGLGTAGSSRHSVPASVLIALLLIVSAARPDLADLPLGHIAVALVMTLALIAGMLESSASVVIVGLAVTYLNVWVATTMFYAPMDNRADVFQAVDQSITIADRYIDQVRPQILLERNDRMRPYFNALASSYLYGYVLISDAYASLTEKPVQAIADGALVIIVSTQPDEQARLSTYFATHGMTGRVLGHERVATMKGDLHLTFVRAMAATDPEIPAR